MSRYKDDLFGKGLDLDVILKIFGYASVSLIVLALPVSVLLASLFTMGTFGEQYELAAMRSSGLSIRKIISPMVVLTLLVAFISFGLSSYVIPLTNLKLYSLLYDVKQLKPTFSLEPGHFNSDIDNYVIRIEDKDVGKEMLYDIMIYDHTEGRGNDRMVMADSGVMKVDPYGTSMNMWLFDGSSFENNYTDKGRTTETESFVRTHYKALYYNFDLSGFSLERTEESDFASHHYMLNLDDLSYSMDTLLAEKDTVVQEYKNYVGETTKIDSSFLDIPDSTLSIPPDNILLTFPKYKRREVMRRALSGANSMQKAARMTASRYEDKDLRFRNYLIEFHAKFSLPVACIIFLFIGAPLGAVVRKGGVGIPILVSVTFYLGFYVIMIQGKKMATEGVVPVWIGVWLPILVLFPLAVLFTYQAASMRKLQFGLVVYAVRTSVQDFLVFILRPVVRLFRGKQVAKPDPEQQVTILPDDLSLPDHTQMAESEMARWEKELGITVEDSTEESIAPEVSATPSDVDPISGKTEAAEASTVDSMELPDMRGDEDELARMARELGITLESEEEKAKPEAKVESTLSDPEAAIVEETPIESMELPDMRGDEDELARMARELGITLESEEEKAKPEAKVEPPVSDPEAAIAEETPIESMELPDMRGDEDELARMERELGITLESEEEKANPEAKVESTLSDPEAAIVEETPIESMELPDMRGDEDELARMERELGISLRGDKEEEETKPEAKIPTEVEAKVETPVSDPKAETNVESTLSDPEAAIAEETPIESMELPDMRGDEDELARMERELGISLRGDKEEEEAKPEAKIPTEVEAKVESPVSDPKAETNVESPVSDPEAAIAEETPIESMELPDMRGDEDELARMERELGISLRGDKEEEEAKPDAKTKSSIEAEPKIEQPQSEPKVEQPETEPKIEQPQSEPKIEQPQSEPKVEQPETEPKVEQLEPEPEEAEIPLKAETPSKREEITASEYSDAEKEEIARWEQELGISLSVDSGDMDLVSLPSLVPESSAPENSLNPNLIDPELANFEQDLDFSIDLDSESEDSTVEVDGSNRFELDLDVSMFGNGDKGSGTNGNGPSNQPSSKPSDGPPKEPGDEPPVEPEDVDTLQ